MLDNQSVTHGEISNMYTKIKKLCTKQQIQTKIKKRGITVNRKLIYVFRKLNKKNIFV